MHARVRRTTVERHLERLRERRTQDHGPDRGRLVVDVADARLEALVIERRRALEPDLLPRREQELDPGMRTALGEDAPRRVEHRRHCRLVVGAEDRPGCIANDPVLDHRLDRRRRRHGVQMRAEEQRLPGRGGLESRVDVAGVRADRRADIVLVRLQPAVAQVPEHQVGDRTLVARWARHGCELREETEDVGGHGPYATSA